MPIVEIEIAAVEAFAEAQVLAGAGPYLRIKGVAKGEIDPAAAENRVIADLEKAPRTARGMVEYDVDFSYCGRQSRIGREAFSSMTWPIAAGR